MRYPKPYFKLDKKGIYLDIEKFYDEIAKYPDGSPLHSISRV